MSKQFDNMDAYKVTKRSIFNPETGSCFDRTASVSDAIRPGGHDQPVEAIDVSAFSFSKTTTRRGKKEFQRKGTGLAGTAGSYQRKVLKERAEEEADKLQGRQVGWALGCLV